MRVLVTGGAGAIGSHLVASLLAGGHDVTVLDDLSSGRRTLVPDGVRFIEGSVADERLVRRVLRESKTERVAHLAALFANQNSVDHPVDDLLINGLGTLNVLLASAELDVGKVLVCSSSCVYGKAAHALTVDELPAPLDTPYAITKHLGETYARWASSHLGLDAVIVRPFNTYGPHEVPGPYRNVIPNFIDRAMRDLPLPVMGAGSETRDFTYIGDTARGIEAALLGDTEPGSAFDIATGEETTILAVARLIIEITGSRGGIEMVPARTWDSIDRRRGDVEPARTSLGFTAEVPLDEGLERTYRWLRSVHG